MRPYQPPIGLSLERAQASTVPSAAGFCSSALPSGTRSPRSCSGGAEHEWGEVLISDPPVRVAYLWHLFFDRSEATEITVTFTAIDSGTRVKLIQSGSEKLGADAGPQSRRSTSHAWQELTGLYRQTVEIEAIRA